MVSEIDGEEGEGGPFCVDWLNWQRQIMDAKKEKRKGRQQNWPQKKSKKEKQRNHGEKRSNTSNDQKKKKKRRYEPRMNNVPLTSVPRFLLRLDA